MKPSTQNEPDRNAAAEAEKTLRLIATLPAPAGIEDRVKAGLHTMPSRSSIIEWPLSSLDGRAWMHGSGMRAAAAAAIVFIVAGGGWSVYSHIRVAPAPAAVVAPQPAGKGGFAAAEAKRVPKTLEGPVVAAPATATKQPGAEKAVPAMAHHHKRHTSTTAATLTAPAAR